MHKQFRILAPSSVNKFRKIILFLYFFFTDNLDLVFPAFSLNGELMMDSLGQEIAFRNIETGEGYVPAMTLGRHQQAKLNFGQDVNTLKYFTFCGLQEGYEPFCV